MQDMSLKSIDRKLSVVIALLTRTISGGGMEGLESVLRQGGLSTAEIASILGKSQRAIQQALKAQGYKE